MVCDKVERASITVYGLSSVCKQSRMSQPSSQQHVYLHKSAVIAGVCGLRAGQARLQVNNLCGTMSIYQQCYMEGFWVVCGALVGQLALRSLRRSVAQIGTQ